MIKRKMFGTHSVIALALLSALPLLAADHEITQQDRHFSQTEITVKVGDTVSFKNDDEVTHNVFSTTPGMEFDLHRQAPGASSTIPFSKVGDAEVDCSIHPRMKLMVHVTK
jgi:plastocyanin